MTPRGHDHDAGGDADLEFAVASAAGLVDDATVVATTVHEVQVLEPGRIPVADHDIRLDLVVTPDRTIIAERSGLRPPARIVWEELTEAKIAAIPLLQRLRDGGS